MSTSDTRPKRALFILISLFALAVLFIGGAGINAYLRFARQHRENLNAQMENVAFLKSDELINWRTNHIATAELIRQNHGGAEHIQDYLANPQDESAYNHIVYWITSYQQHPEANHIWLFDNTGSALLAESKPQAPVPQAILTVIPQALTSSDILWVDFYENETSQTTQLALLIPIFTEDIAGDFVGIMIVEINPQVYLFPYLQTWPITTSSATTLLVRQENEEVVWLNAPPTAVTQRYSLSATDIPAVQAVLGETGPVAGQDGQGVAVLADIHPIPDSSWYVVTQINVAEANGTLITRAWEILGICLVAVGMVSTTLYIIWREIYLRSDRQRRQIADTLNQSETQYRTLVETLDVALCRWLPDTTLLFTNEKYRQVFGLKDQGTGQKWLDFLPASSREQTAAFYEQLAHNPYTVTYEHAVTIQNGIIRHYQWIDSPLFDSHGQLLGFQSIGIDITNRKQMELALREAEARWQFALEGAGDGVWDWNAQTNKVFYSRQWKTMLGFSEGEISDSLDEWQSRVHPDDLAPVLAQIEQHFAGQTPVYISEHRLRAKDGTYKWILDRGKVVEWDENDKPVRVIGTHADITARKRAEEISHLQQQRLQDAQKVAKIQNWAVDVSRSLIHLGPDDNQLLGWPTGVYPLIRLQEIVHPDDKERVEKAWGQILESPMDCQYRAWVQGKWHWVHVKSQPVNFQEGSENFVYGMTQNITEQKQAELLILAQRDLARITSTVGSSAEAWPLCLNIALRVTGMDSGGIYLFDERQQNLEIVYHQGLSEVFIRAASRYPAHSPNVQLIRNGQTIYHQALHQGQNELYLAEGLHAAAIVPIHHQGNVIGCLNLASHSLDQVTDFARQALETIVTEIGNLATHLQASALLHASEEKYRSLINSQDATIATVDADGVFHYINSIGADRFAVSPEAIIGQSAHDFFSLESADWLMVQVRQVFHTGEGLVTEYQYQANPTNKPHWRHVSIQPIRNGAGAVTLAMVNSVDITEQKQLEQALQEAQDRLLEAQKLAHMGSWEWDIEKETLKWSEGVYHIFGMDPAHFTPSVETFENAIHPEDKEAFLRQRAQMLAEKQFAVIDHRIVLPEGQIRFVQERTRLILDDTGHVIRVIGTVQDITEAKITEAALRTSEERYRLIANYVDDIVWQLDTNLCFVYASPATERVLGYSAIESQGFNVARLLDESGLAQMKEVVQSRLANPDLPSKPTEYKMRHKAGHWVDVEVLSSPIYDNQQNLSGFVGIARDITERKQAEAALRDSEERLRLSLYATNQGLYDLNVQTGETIVNRQYAEMLGYDPEQFVETNQAWLNRLHPDDKAKTAQVYRDYLTGIRPDYRVEFRQQTKQGDWKWILSIGKVVEYDAEGQPLRMLGTHTDMTKQKEMEESLRRSEGLLREAQRIGRIGHMEWKAPDEYLICSDELYNIFELPPGTPISQYTISEMMTAEDRERLLHLDQQLFAQRADLNYEYHITLPSGRERWLHQQGRVTYGDNGIPTRMIAVIQDITERKQGEEALRASEERAQAMLQAIPDLMFRLDRHGVFLDYKADIQDLYTPNDISLIGQRNREIAPPEFADLVEQKINATLESATVQTFEYQLLVPGRGLRDYEARMAPGSNNDEVIAIVRDITERKHTEEKLRQSQLRVELALRGANAGMWDWNVQTGETVFNERWAEIVGYSLAELEPISIQTWADLCHPDDLLISNTRLQKHFVGESETYECEVRMKHRNGSWVWVSDRGRVVEWDAAGKPLRMSGTHIDVTQQWLAQEALRASEEKYRGLMESLDSVVVTVDETGRVLYLNDRAAAQLNDTPANLIGKTMHDLFPEPVVAEQIGYIHQAIQEDRGVLSEAQIFIQGEYRWYRIMVQPIHDEAGKVIYVLINFTDIHQLKQIQQELLELNHTLEERIRERTAEVRDLYNYAPNGYHSLNKEGQFVLINQTELDWLGYSHEDLINRKTFADLLTPDSQLIFSESFPRFKRDGVVKDLEFEMVRKDGSILPVLLNAIAINDEQGQFSHGRSTIVDITERRKALQALQESRDELRIANEMLERAAQMKDEFLANMSHELRTPLNAILTFSESMLEEIAGPLNDRQKSWIQNIASSGEHLLSLINDILDLSKVEAGQMELDLEPVSIGDVCQSSLLFVKQIALKKSLKLDYQLENPLADVEVDQRRLKQMLVNLLTNAVKFTPPGGKVSLRVGVDEEAGTLRFVVEDTGIGIAAADLQRLFQPFTQLDSRLNRQHEGTGLGLALVRRLAELHGGSVTVESEPGVGSRFTVALPYHSASGRGVGRSAAAGTPSLPTPPQQDLPGGHILLAEDNEINILALADFLKSRHYQLSIARNGREALELAETVQPDVILMDIQMPEMDGLEAIRQLRRMPGFQTTPIVALTALAMPGDREKCLSAGANEYLTKPVSLKVLHGLIQELLL